MAKATLNAVINVNRSITVTRSTDDALGSDIAALVFDDTAAVLDVVEAIAALTRAFHRERSKVNELPDYPLSGTSDE